LSNPTPETGKALVAILDRAGTLDQGTAPEELVTLCRELEAERDRLRQRNTELHRRCQKAESAVAQFKRQWDEYGGPRGGSFGRALLASECARMREIISRLQKDAARYREALQRIATQHPINDEPLAAAHSLRAHRALAPNCECCRCMPNTKAETSDQ
jgi:uncharacterized protein involved in exopolysaccharide biosynthesis